MDVKPDTLVRNRKPVISGATKGRVILDGREMLLLTANNYLGLAADEEIVSRACDAIRQYGLGSTLNPPLATTPLHDALCDALAQFHQVDAALLFNSCTSANVAVACTLVGKGDRIFSDRLNHASIVDGCRLSSAEAIVYEHGDLDDLGALLATPFDGRKLVISDGVFSMEGNFADLPGLIALCRKHDALLVVDESHAAGVAGPGGRGTAALQECLGQIDLYTGTLSKAFGGAAGGYVAGRADLIHRLHDNGRFYIFTSSIPASSAAGALAAIERIMRGDDAVRRLADNTRRLRYGLQSLGLTLLGDSHPITPILIGDEEKALALSRGLLDEGVYIAAITYPVVARGEARLRAQPSAAHSLDDIDDAVSAVGRVARRLGIL
ncbi:aminotransferase class I/II-fold pyridoxal phosphate-dependent enzyme [Bradyrhizobium canariense]|uniref:2-amino-3-ketobutyrate coenzyme A ligase n=1 Tax=Bradyrhizobium canariense TaxID=255045 RepID=A0A1H1XQZ1_9BRAD|nr:aminotransferase class I/II-fold pyridoxal phosphate-dependent enzyme [Bradyrhizobium canariense]SDT11216.1 2-amino-3-ketobutyrate coenzyme A ligase [Bradyrhizobium canariense]